GGATACANHLRDFGDNVGLFTQSRPLLKQRYLFDPFGIKVFAIEDVTVSENLAKLEVSAPLRNYDVVIVADYGHGVITESLIGQLMQHSRFLAVMAQSNSANFGFNLVTRYPRADYVALDEMEVRLAMQYRYGPIEPLADKLRQRMDARMLAVTLGHRGCLVVDALGQTLT